MEFDSDLSKLQGILYSLGSQGLLNNSDSLHTVVDAVKEITKSLSDDAKTKLVFFMVLNTQLEVTEELKDDEFVGLLVNVTPHIDKDYLILYAYHLNLQSYLFKVIENCPGVLSLELLEVIVRKLKEPEFHKDEFGVEHFYQLWESIFVKICKISEGIHLGDSPKEFTLYFEDFYDFIQKVLVTTTKMDSLEKFVGFHLYYFFKTILHIIKIYKNPSLSDNPIYKLSIHNKSEAHSGNAMKVCINLIFAKIFKILEMLTLDLWLTLSECYFDFDSKSSIQLFIGGLVYDILEEIKGIDVPPDVLNCLSTLSINKLDLMAKADLDEIITNVKGRSKEWFEILVRHSAFTERKSLECLLENLNLASAEDLKVILNTSYEYLRSCQQDENLDLVKELFLAAVKKIPDCSDWLERVFAEYQPDLLSTPCIQDEIIETFNKISKENVCERNLILLCMQSPFETIRKICQIALCGTQQAEFIIEILKLLKPACNVSPVDSFTLLDDILLKILLEEVKEKEKQLFVNFVIRLNNDKFLGPFFFKNTLKILKGYLENENLEKALLCLDIVQALLDSASFHVEAAALLVFMSQVLEYFSWDLETFSALKAVGRDKVASIAAIILRSLKEVDGSTFDWARQEILKSWVVNQACFCDLWFSSGRIWRGDGKFHSCILALAHSHRKTNELRNFLITFDKPFEVRTSIILSLTMLLPVLTFREWNSIFNHLIIVSKNTNSGKNDVDVYHDVLDMFSSCLCVLTLELNSSKEIFACHQYCLRNFARLAKNYCPKINGGFLFRIFEKTVLILDMIEDDQERKLYWDIISPLWIELNIFEDYRDEVKELVPLLDGVAVFIAKSHTEEAED